MCRLLLVHVIYHALVWYNTAMKEDILITKASGEKEPFDPLKLEFSLKKAKAPDALIEKIVPHILEEVEDGMTTAEIYRHAFDLLKEMRKPSALRYSLKRAILDLGPSGFPFEKLISEIFATQGYTTATDQVVKGKCAEHEVDVVAYNDEKLIMMEAKFHNSLGIDSDLKVALYVRARFNDLSGIQFAYGKKRELDEGWLVTNTKFTTSAIRYAECQRMKIIGWNYPIHGSLQDMIEAANLHPLTCLTTLNASQKTFLLNNGLVLCKSIPHREDLLRAAGLSKDEIHNVFDEVNLLYSEPVENSHAVSSYAV
jgi:hypothetical protein